MSVFTPNELNSRKHIIDSHIYLGKFLTANIVNKLIYLFNANDNANNIIKYIKDERNMRKLNNDINIISDAYGENNNPTLYLGIIKDNKELLHLTIHLAIRNLNPEHSGIIHISKNIYKSQFSRKNPRQKKLYALINIKQPTNKLNSLKFSIANGYNTKNINTAYLYDTELQQEMDVIIAVLNRLFDETNTRCYIGDSRGKTSALSTNFADSDINTYNQIIPINNKTNKFLTSLNTATNHISRKNKGYFLMPSLINYPITKLKPHKQHKINTRKTYTRKQRSHPNSA